MQRQDLMRVQKGREQISKSAADFDKTEESSSV